MQLSSFAQPLHGGLPDPCRGPGLHPADALQAWKEAEALAWEAERCLYAAWYAFRVSGLSVPLLLQNRATAARALARQRLDEAIAAGKAATVDSPR